MKIVRFILILALMASIFAQTGLEIVKTVEDRKKPKDIQTDLEMVLTNNKGKTRTNELRSISKDDSEKQIIWFFSPADDKGVAFLKIEHDDRDDEMRLWLPAFKKVRRISSSKKGDAFMGSDISYEDMTSRELDEYTYKLLGKEDYTGQQCYKVEILPKPETDTDYSRHIEWITIDTHLLLYSESYDRAGDKLKIRTMEYAELKGYLVPVKIHVENIKKKHTTQLSFNNLILDSSVDDDLFQEKNLKRMPGK